MNEMTFGRRMLAGVSLPWSGFVAAFIYFTILTAVVIGGVDVPAPAMAVAYVLPVALYAALLVSRAAHALASLDIGLHHEPHAIIR